MNEIGDGASELLTTGAGEDPSAMERRIYRSMIVMVALAVLVSAPFMPWRVTTGLLLGGVLALFNHHWLRSSIAAIFGSTVEGARPRIRAARYILRYFVIAAVVVLSYRLNLISLVAALAGMCVFVPAALVEGARQLYLAIVHREET